MNVETNVAPIMAEAVLPATGIGIDIDDPELLQEDAVLMEVDQNVDTNATATEHAAPLEAAESSSLRPEAVLLYGVDHLSTADVKSYASHYFPPITPEIEWVDDSSVLFVFDSESTAKKALDAFTSEAEYYDQPPEAAALRSAKVHPQNGKFPLKVRVALQNDRKTKRSRERSKYYLFHGDPREEDYEQRRQETRSRRNRRRSASPEKHAHMDLVEFSRGRRRENNDDDFPSVLKDTYTPITKSWAKASSIDRYTPSVRDSVSLSRRDRHAPREPPRRRSISPERHRGGSRPRTSDPERISDDVSSRSLAVRLGMKGGDGGNPDNRVSDFASRLSVKESDDSNGGRRRRRAHHLEFD
ncbi:hypothetical protein V1517DRAFT_313553 [Lipomyces orientalis]|uniref:Uncharacterized protein n=1 Tax=Lipomyces orientalis TaxID=1233043 RepID=A0ACC3TYB4_9ASCO